MLLSVLALPKSDIAVELFVVSALDWHCTWPLGTTNMSPTWRFWVKKSLLAVSTSLTQGVPSWGTRSPRRKGGCEEGWQGKSGTGGPWRTCSACWEQGIQPPWVSSLLRSKARVRWEGIRGQYTQWHDIGKYAKSLFGHWMRGLNSTLSCQMERPKLQI